MPVVHAKLLLEILLVVVLFALLTIGTIAAVQSWLRRRSQAEDDWDGASPGHGGGRSGGLRWGRSDEPRWEVLDDGARRQRYGLTAQPAPDADFGLLATVSVVPAASDAARLRRQLADAGIRATTTVDRDGRHRVLVFASELYRARRVGGTSG